MTGLSIDRAPSPFGYSCPFCPVVIEEPRPLLSPALVAFETHLDVHMARGDRLVSQQAAAA